MAGMSIYEIDGKIAAILDGYEVVDEETGEIMGLDALESLQMERDQKVENIGCYVKNLKAQGDAIKAEEQNLAARRKAIEEKVDRLKEYLIRVTAGKGYKGVRVAMTVRNTTSVNITDVNRIPEKYLRTIPEYYQPDKMAISAALKSGEEVEGCELVSHQSITIK